MLKETNFDKNDRVTVSILEAILAKIVDLENMLYQHAIKPYLTTQEEKDASDKLAKLYQHKTIEERYF